MQTVFSQFQSSLLIQHSNNIPEIITAAAKSTLGIFALMIIAIAILAFYFFRKSKDNIKVLIFLAMLLGVGLFGYAIVRQTGDKTEGTPSAGFKPPEGWTLHQTIDVLAQQDGLSARYRNCDEEALRRIKVKSEDINATSKEAIIRLLPEHLKAGEPRVSYKVTKGDGFYEIDCGP